jgi:uncharacterized protein (TIGR03435 family)
MVVAKKGPKFGPSRAGDTSSGPQPVNRMRFKDLRALAAYLTRLGSWPGQPSMPVIDKTGLTGDFDIELDYATIMAAASEHSGAPPTNESIFEETVLAMQDKLGLELKRQKALADILIIDRVEKPSEN